MAALAAVFALRGLRTAPRQTSRPQPKRSLFHSCLRLPCLA